MSRQSRTSHIFLTAITLWLSIDAVATCDDLATEIGAIIESRSIPSITELQDRLVVKIGDYRLAAIGAGRSAQSTLSEWLVLIESFRHPLFGTERDRNIMQPTLSTIEAEIRDAFTSILQNQRNETEINANVERLTDKWEKAIEVALREVARARGLNTALIRKERHRGWLVQVKAPEDATIRYVPYLNFLLCDERSELVQWITCRPGDTLRLRGRYRMELLQDDEVQSSQQPFVEGNIKTIRFD